MGLARDVTPRPVEKIVKAERPKPCKRAGDAGEVSDRYLAEAGCHDQEDVTRNTSRLNGLSQPNASTIYLAFSETVNLMIRAGQSRFRAAWEVLRFLT